MKFFILSVLMVIGFSRAESAPARCGSNALAKAYDYCEAIKDDHYRDCPMGVTDVAIRYAANPQTPLENSRRYCDSAFPANYVEAHRALCKEGVLAYLNSFGLVRYFANGRSLTACF